MSDGSVFVLNASGESYEQIGNSRQDGPSSLTDGFMEVQKMRLFLVVIFCVLVSPILAYPTDISPNGDIVYARAPLEHIGGPDDIVKRNSRTGNETILVSHTQMPEGFVNDVSFLRVSPDNKYIVLGQQRGYSGGGIWLWEKKTRRFKKILSEPAQGIADWSRSGRYLLVQSSNEHTLVYDTSSNRFINTALPPTLKIVTWSAVEDSLIVVSNLGTKGSTAQLFPIKGKPRFLFSWPSHILQIEQSRDSLHYALFDGSSVFIKDNSNSSFKKLDIRSDNESFSVSMQFNLKGTELAVLTDASKGEPLRATVSELWIADVSASEIKRLARWEEVNTLELESSGSLPGDLVGWLPNGNSILLTNLEICVINSPPAKLQR